MTTREIADYIEREYPTRRFSVMQVNCDRENPRRVGQISVHKVGGWKKRDIILGFESDITPELIDRRMTALYFKGQFKE